MTRHTGLNSSAISGFLQAVKRFFEKTPTDLPRRAVVVVLFVCSVALTTPISRVFAQIATGRIVGRVTDASGAVISGATVTITNSDTSVAQTVRSSANGDYVFQAVNPGTYTLRVTASGFGEFTRSGIQAHIQDYLTIDISLSLGTVSQQVAVTAATPLLQQQDASVGQTINEAQVNNMPLQSRDWTTLGLLAAGTVTTGGASNAEFNVMGLDWTQNDFRLDGIDDNVEIYGGGNIHLEPVATMATQRSCHRPTLSRNSNCRPATLTRSTATPRAESLMPRSNRGPTACMGIFGNTFAIRSSTPTTTSQIRPIRRAPLIIKTNSAVRLEDRFISPSSITAGTGPSSSLITRAPGSVRLRPVPRAFQLP